MAPDSDLREPFDMSLHFQLNFYPSSGGEYRSLISSLHLYFLVYNFIIQYASLFYSYTRWFRCVDLSEMLDKAHILDDIEGSDQLPMVERLQILTAPVDVRAGQMHHFRTMVTAILENHQLMSPASGAGPHARSEDLESAYKHLSLYYWFHYRYPQSFPEIGKAAAERTRCVNQLIAHIRQGLKRHCKSCGKVLPAKGAFGICESCHQAQRRQRRWDRDDY